MKFKKLRRSGLIVSDLALGTMVFGEKESRGTPPAEVEKIDLKDNQPESS